MGWGFMMGMSKGLDNYRGLMAETRRNNWEIKKEELAYQRDKTLRELDQQFRSSEAQTQREWSEKQTEKGYTHDKEVTAETRKYNEDVRQEGYARQDAQRAEDRKWAKADQAEARNYQKTWFDYTNAEQINNEIIKTEKIYEKTQELEQAERVKILDAAQKSPMWAKLSDQEKDMKRMQIVEPKIYQIFQGSRLSSEDKVKLAGHRADAYEAGTEVFMNMPEETQRKFMKALPEGNGNLISAANEFATAYADEAVGMHQFNPDNTELPKTPEIRLEAKDIEDMAQDLVNGDPEVPMMIASTHPEDAAKVRARAKELNTRNNSYDPRKGRTVGGVIGKYVDKLEAWQDKMDAENTY